MSETRSLRLGAIPGVVLCAVLVACGGANRPVFELCDDDPVGGLKIYRDGQWYFSDLGGHVKACDGSAQPCMAEPIALSVPPGGYTGGPREVQWRAGGIDFYMLMLDLDGETLGGIRAETADSIYSYDYDADEGIKRLIIARKDGRGFSTVHDHCGGELKLDDLAVLLDARQGASR